MDNLLTEIAESGWLVNNIYQLDDDTWRANLRRPDGDGDWFTAYASATTAYEALAECMNHLATAEYAEADAATHTIDKTATPSLLIRLGLVKPTAPMRRPI